MGKENSIVLFLGVLTCALSLLDFTGQTFHIKKQYRDLPWRRKWQIKNGIYELTFGGGVLLLQPIQKLNFRPLTVVVGCLAIAAFILMILNDNKLKKGLLIGLINTQKRWCRFLHHLFCVFTRSHLNG